MTIPSTPITLESLLALQRRIGRITLHGPIVLTTDELIAVRLATPLSGIIPVSIGMEIVEVPTAADVMPMVHELRRRGKRPVFTGIIMRRNRGPG